MTIALETQALVKRFGAVTALEGVSLQVGYGQVVALLGPNGAGKSTLLRILATTVLPDSGHASLAGHDVVAHPVDARRAAGLVLGDERSWYWRLTGRANLEFFAVLAGYRPSDARPRADELLAQVGLSEAADRRFAGYSSGMRARLSLARALLTDPNVLLLDEPSRSLDPVSAAALRVMLRERAHAHDAALLFATHDLHEAAEVADAVIVLSHGRVVARQPGGGNAAELERLLLEAEVEGP